MWVKSGTSRKKSLSLLMGRCSHMLLNRDRCRLSGSLSFKCCLVGALSLRFESLSLIRWDAVAIVLLNRDRYRLDESYSPTVA